MMRILAALLVWLHLLSLGHADGFGPSTTPVPNPAIVSTSGTISAQGGSISLDVTGYASANISVVGTFVGQLRVRGGADGASALGGRLVFKSGVGSLGKNTIDNTGVALSSDYRVVAGGKILVVDAPTWTSGSAAITITASPSPSILFVNGPVHNAVEEAIRAGRSFSASTSIQTVSAGNYLNSRLCNPAGSNVIAYVYQRRMDNGTTGATEYYGVANPLALTGTVATVAPSNFITGGVSSALSMTWGMSTSRLDSSPSTASPIGGVAVPTSGTNIDNMRVVPPGACFGHFMGGAGGGLVQAARLGIAWFWIEETQN